MKDQISKRIYFELISNAQARRISRREFMQGMIATGVSLSAASSLWTIKVHAQTPKKGGKFKIGIAHGQTTDNLDPATYENGFMSSLTFGVNNYLTEVSNDGSLKPEVAESWEPSADAKTWTFKLRQGVTFHNGKDVTAEDVIASINHHRGEASQSAAKPIVAPITGIKADGKGVVVFELESGNADFPFIISDYHLPILQANADGTPNWQDGVGCGAYKLKNFDPGVRADFERNSDYWKSDRGHFDEIEMISIVDPASRTNGLVSGEVDAIDRVDLKTVHLLQRKPDVKIHSIAGNQHFTFPMHTNVAPFDNNDVRLALKYAINREEIVEKVLQGYGAVGNDHPIGSGQRYYASELEQTSYDPERAKEHLKKAGMDSLDVDLHVADAAFAGAVDAGVLYAEHAKPAGININVVREPNDGYWSNVWLKKPFCACYWSGRPTEDWMFSTAYASGVDWNDTFFEHEKFNQLLEAARSELDEAKRREMYVEMQTIMNRDGGTIVSMFASYVYATQAGISTEEQLGTDGAFDGNRLMERWWSNS